MWGLLFLVATLVLLLISAIALFGEYRSQPSIHDELDGEQYVIWDRWNKISHFCLKATAASAIIWIVFEVLHL